MAKIFKSTIRENRRILTILHNRLAEEKRILQGYGKDESPFLDLTYDMDKHMERVALLEQLVGEIVLIEVKKVIKA